MVAFSPCISCLRTIWMMHRACSNSAFVSPIGGPGPRPKTSPPTAAQTLIRGKKRVLPPEPGSEIWCSQSCARRVRHSVQSENLKLDGVYERMKQRSFGDYVVEDQYIEKGYRFHVGDVGQIQNPRSLRFCIERRIGNRAPWSSTVLTWSSRSAEK